MWVRAAISMACNKLGKDLIHFPFLIVVIDRIDRQTCCVVSLRIPEKNVQQGAFGSEYFYFCTTLERLGLIVSNERTNDRGGFNVHSFCCLVKFLLHLDSLVRVLLECYCLACSTTFFFFSVSSTEIFSFPLVVVVVRRSMSISMSVVNYKALFSKIFLTLKLINRDGRLMIRMLIHCLQR